MNKEKKSYKIVEKRIRIQKDLLIEHLHKMPILEVACGKVGVSRATVYRWRNEDKEFGQAFDEAIENGRDLLDEVTESKLIGLIDRSDPNAIFFYLKHRHHLYSPVAAAHRERKRMQLEEQEKKLSPDELAHIEMMTRGINAFLAQYNEVGLIKHDSEPDNHRSPPSADSG